MEKKIERLKEALSSTYKGIAENSESLIIFKTLAYRGSKQVDAPFNAIVNCNRTKTLSFAELFALRNQLVDINELVDSAAKEDSEVCDD